MGITSKGQVTIPAAIRNRAGLSPHTEVTFLIDGRAVQLVPARSAASDGRGGRAVTHLRGRGDAAMSTDAIMALTREG